MVYEQESSPAKRFVERVGKRNLIIAGVVLLIGVAVILNWAIFAGRDDGFDYSANAGMSGSDAAGTTPASLDSGNATADSFFSSTQVSRARARDEALEVLQAVVDSASSDEATKTQALADISQIAKDMEAESNIETLVVAKGFEQCVAVISSGTVNVVVKAEKLTQSDIAIINEIVYDQSGIKPANVKIVQK